PAVVQSRSGGCTRTGTAPSRCAGPSREVRTDCASSLRQAQRISPATRPCSRSRQGNAMFVRVIVRVVVLAAIAAVLPTVGLAGTAGADAPVVSASPSRVSLLHLPSSAALTLTNQPATTDSTADQQLYTVTWIHSNGQQTAGTVTSVTS